MIRRLTLRTQLMLLYAGPFCVAGAALLTVPLMGLKETAPVGTVPAPAPQPVTSTPFPFDTWSVSMAVLLIVSIVLGWVVAGRFLQPLREITATARDISASNLHRRLGPADRRGEFAELASTLDELFERLEAAFTAQRHFVANASHELRTPLTAERALLQVALADPDASTESLRAACREVLALGSAQERMIEALLTLAVGERGVEQREPFDLADVAGDVLESGQGTSAEQRVADVRLVVDLAPAPAAGDPQLVGSLVANLVGNALRHNVPGGRVEVTTAAVEGRARLTVRNTGPVVPPGEVDRLFEPFQRLHGRRLGHGEGHGLGLAIVRAVASAHGADLAARARPEGGLDVEVTFR
ncbi:HAMP domain-containing sensor histidine kinase [Dactylosporangium fulvum]|uniref:histidine kinase n=1 Tax=Dactylosporangium fulvum TaxID=53359 RepID=A0ABY5WCR0_9ACTN|nr:ATP-binding protein [Dactylosporangium fulvum]UWP87215.1 ATP-binding protein [Dactylosporangium fulvum]